MGPESRQPLVSATIIVRDEADFLRSCLASIAPLCDEIVVVDTGSVDSSVEVAQSFGAVLAHRAWDGDFSAARNTALDLASGEWILYIDADEQLVDIDVAVARAEIAAATDAVALLPRFRSRPQFSAYREYRMWRNRPDIRFRNKIHETMVPDIERIAADEKLVVKGIDSVEIVHYGYEGDQTRKHLRNLPMLEAQIVDSPERVYLWNHLATVRDALGDVAGAVNAWESGIAVIRRLGLLDRTDIICYVDYSLHLIANGFDAAAIIDEGLALAPWCAALYWSAALNHRCCERYAESVPHLRALLEVDPKTVDPSAGYRLSILTDWAMAELADSLYQLGDVSGAAAMYRQASDAEPDDRSLRAKALAMESYARCKPDLDQVGHG